MSQHSKTPVEQARTLGRLVERAGRRMPEADGALRYLFPTPRSIADLVPDNIDLPPGCARQLRQLAGALCTRPAVFHSCSDRVVAELAVELGVDSWTAGYIAMRGLGEPDALPAGDAVVRHRAARAQRPLNDTELEVLAERWRPFRGYAVLHLWELEPDARA